MPSLQSIASFPQDAVDLLEAVGYLNAEEVCNANRHELLEELTKANTALGLMDETPDSEQLSQWIAWSTEAMGVTHVAPASPSTAATDTSSGEPAQNSVVESKPVSPENFEDDPEVRAMLEISPDADPVPVELMKRNSLSVQDIPEGILLTECQGDVEMKVMTAQGRLRQQHQASEVRRSGLMTSRIRSFSEHENSDHHVKPLEKGEQRDVVSLSEGLNAGLSPESRRFVRGVLHPDPMSVRVSAFFAVLVQVLLVVTMFGVPALIIYDQMMDAPEAVWWIVGLVSASLLSALCYLFWGLAARCRVCGQRQFAPKKCLKNRKAHHIPLIGYIFPTALHAIFFKWFYCTYCGTAVRLKK